MIKILPIASGSTGNCMLLDFGGQRVMIDLGVTAKAVRTALCLNGYVWDDIDAVLITHTHIDHVKGLEVCLKRVHAPVFMSAVSRDKLLPERAEVLPYTGRTEILPGLWVTPVRTSHDCPGSIGFLIETADVRVGYVTDLGVMPESTLELLKGADCVVIESNHNEEMLRYGPYPVYLKKRILSDHGHLSNEAASAAVAWLAERGTRHFLLAHLSRENNRPEIALAGALQATAGMDVDIRVLPVCGTEMFVIQ